MNVRELVATLQEFPEDAPVVMIFDAGHAEDEDVFVRLDEGRVAVVADRALYATTGTPTT